MLNINDALKAYNELVQKQYDDYDDNSSQSKYACLLYTSPSPRD